MSAVKGWASRIAGLVGLVVLASCGGGGDVAITVDVPDQSTRADGQTAAIINISVNRGGKPVADDGMLKISTDLGEFGAIDTTDGIPPTDNSDNQKKDLELSSGTSKAQLFSVRTGTANLVVTYTDATGASATKKASVTFGNGANAAKVASIQWVTIDHPVVNLADSAGQKSLQVQFRVLDDSGSPVSDGVKVTFSISASGASQQLDASLSTDNATTANGNGLVSTVLNGGFISGSIKVTASAANGVAGTTEPISVEGGPANMITLDFGCDHNRVGGFEASGLVLNCPAIVGDRNRKFAPGVNVQFMTEAGTISNSIPTDPDAATGLGKAVAVHQTGNPYPEDVSPTALDGNIQFTNCPALSDGHVGTCNPRDGWVTVVAYTNGEECYDDINGNGKYDQGVDTFPATGHPECDQGEPFVDSNDNGQWDPGEQYIDVDHNGQYTPKNGVYDGADHHVIWRSSVIVWTGTGAITGGQSGLNEGHCAPDTLTFTYQDGNGNLPAADGTGDAVQINSNGSVALDESTLPLSGPSNAVTTTGASATTAQKVPSVTNTQLSFGIEDGDVCSNPPTPGSFSISLVVDRTLDDSGQAGQEYAKNGAFSGSYQ